MFQLPQFTPVQDNTGALLLKQAELAREQQQQMASLIQKNEAVRQEAFGGAQKQLFDIASAQKVPAEVQRQILQDGMQQLTALYKDRKNVTASDLSMMAMDTLVNAKSKATAYQQYLENGEKFVADAKENGFDELNLKTALANNMYDEQQVMTPQGPSIVRVPKDPTKLGDPLQFLNKEISTNEYKYLDRAKSAKAVDDMVAGLKPAEMKMATTKDLTGDMTLKVAYTEQKYPFTRVQDVVVEGQPAKKNVLDTVVDESLTKKFGKPVQVLSKSAFDFFYNNPSPKIRAEVAARGRDYINDHNRRLGLNPAQISEQNVQQLMAQFPDMINPFDEQNRVIFSNLAMTQKLTPQFGEFGDISVTKDKARDRIVVGGGYDPSMYDKRGNLRPELRFPAVFAQVLNQDRDLMSAATEVTFDYKGQPLTGKRTGDSLPIQVLKENNKQATVVSRVEEPGVIYVVELDEDGEMTDNVERYAGEEAKRFGSRVASRNGSNTKTFLSKFDEGLKTVIPMSDAEVKQAQNKVAVQAQKDAGASFVATAEASVSQLNPDTPIKPKTPMRLNLAGTERTVVEIRQKQPGSFVSGLLVDPEVQVVLQDGKILTYKNRAELKQALKAENKL